MNILFNNLKPQWDAIKEEALIEINNLFESSAFILGEQVDAFEKKFSSWNNSTFSVGVSNGTDGLEIAARSLNMKDRSAVFIPANTFIATFIGIYKVYPNADYYLVDCDDSYLMNVDVLENVLSQVSDNYDNLLVVPVHLYGATVDMQKLMYLKSIFGFYIIEDCSQAHGAISNTGKFVGNDGDVNVFSLYPGKNLGAAGDAAVITLNNEKLYKRILKLRNLGSDVKYNHELFSGNHRLDTIQAIILSLKLDYFDNWTADRIDVANYFSDNINNSKIIKPVVPDYCKKHVYHIYCVRVTNNRKKIITYLNKLNIPTLIHYPIPLFLSSALKDIPFKNADNQNTIEYSDQILSLPIHPFVQLEEAAYITEVLNNY
jgi:dTDP-4-amino-4,6-dideoxygalactose transaminase